MKMHKNFGIERVLEPKGTLPVTAWKLDNSAPAGPTELKVNLKRIAFERENFYQLCSICEYDENLLKERILKIVNERGKLHNPYTESSGLFMGTVAEAGPEYEMDGLKPGDNVVCMTPLAGQPIYIEEIEDIDIYYGEITCRGYVICFETAKLIKTDDVESAESIYLLRALEEEGSLYGISQELKHRNIRKVAIIGSNMAETIFYAQMVRDSAGPEVSVSFVIDSAYFSGIIEDELRTIFGSLIDDIYLVDLSKPYDAAEKIMGNQVSEAFDAVINLENIMGCESVASLIAKDKGIVCYTSINSRYGQGLLLVDCLGKDIMNYSLDGYSSFAYDFAVGIVKKTEPVLQRLDKFYAGKKKIPYKIVRAEYKGRIQTAVQQIDGFIYKSRMTAEVVEEVINVAQYDCNVIIQGETGVGKEKICNLIHQNSPRRDKPCIKINCATIQESLAESEFFGYEKGSFTGAQASGKAGYFELANNGTLFLDEIGSLSLVMQSKLLRVLQENTYYRVGGVQPKHVNVRVVCANNIPLKKLVEEGKFREDLYYRLNICLINVPPLRMRKEDIECLSEAFLKNYSEKYGVIKSFSPDAHKQLTEYHWPGNVRELENTVHRLYISEKDKIIGGYAVEMLLNQNVFNNVVTDIKKEHEDDEFMDFNLIMDEQEKKLIEYALKKKGTTRKAAEFLGIPQTTLARKKLKHNL
ncbi:MAG: sigma 54-interacting transcriptional regulator [Firmicutes bacterium]|nr:sigma 54-interacting transcriptional regulator [Bacillota bacterium]